MELNSAEIQQGYHQLIEVRKLKRDFASLNNYYEFRAEMFSIAIQPWVKNAAKCKNATDNIPEGVWAMIGCEKTDGVVSNIILLAFAELDFEDIAETKLPFEGVSSFDEWVAHFNPKTMGDWLMVPKLYLTHLRTGKNLPALTATPDPWIDAVLCQSRGMLMWSHQFIEIIRLIADVSLTEANQIRSNWVMMKAEIKETLGNVHYPPTQQTLLQIIKERTSGMEYLGSPDYFFADWLSKHYHPTKQISAVGEDETR